MNNSEPASSSNAREWKSGFLACAVVLLVSAGAPRPASCSVAESVEARVIVAQNQGKADPVLVDPSCSTSQLAHALEHAELRYQRRYAAELLGERGAKEALPNLLNALKDREEVVQKAAAESLAKIGDESIFPALIEDTTHLNPRVREYSAYVLGRLGTKENRGVVKSLESMAADKDKNVRGEVIYALYEIGSPSSRDIFVQGLNDEEPKARKYAAIALGNVKDPAAGKALAIAMQRESDENVRRMIASALGKVGSEYAVSALVDAIPHETESVRTDIAVALGEIKTPEAVQALVGLLSDPSANVRSKAAASLGATKDPSATRALAGALKDRAAIVRRQASQALVNAADASVINELVEALGDADSTVADNAAVALVNMGELQSVHALINVIDSPNVAQAKRALSVLEEITHRPYGSDVGKWKTWYEENFKAHG
ncbi:HEAT repeat domain-containing protein [Candidatus Poribacteria bacterium]|nr:HEAT repeat domain-containing protein [Candidatus Poribacteria bacterium]